MAEGSTMSIGKITTIAYGVGILIVVFIVFKVLNKFNILGKSEATKEAEKLGTDPTFVNNVTNQVAASNSDFGSAIRKRFGSKPTKAQLDSLLPNIKNYPALVRQIMEAHNNFTPNSADKIFGVYKQLRSQYEISFFNTTLSLALKSDAFGILDKLMKDSDMQKLREIINAKPLI